MTAPLRTRELEILLVEDDEGDVVLATEALESSSVSNNVHVTRNGEEALRFLRRTDEFTTAPRPDLVLLDLNLPRVDGRQVLAHVKGDELLRRIPVVVLTTSSSVEDIAGSYDLHANAFVTKPTDVTRFLHVVQRVAEFFGAIAQRPSQ